MKLSLSEIKMIQHVLRTTGEKTEDDKGNETYAPRTLNGEESSQRRHFNKSVKSILEAVDEKIKVAIEPHNALIKEVREKVEKGHKGKKLEEKDVDLLVSKDDAVQASFKKASEDVKAFGEEKQEVEVTDKTLSVIKKYYKEYSEKVGFTEGDDEVIESLEEVLK